jgi:hypothetical protein
MVESLKDNKNLQALLTKRAGQSMMPNCGDEDPLPICTAHRDRHTVDAE